LKNYLKRWLRRVHLRKKSTNFLLKIIALDNDLFTVLLYPIRKPYWGAAQKYMVERPEFSPEETDIKKDKPITIPDLLQVADKLYKGLIQLSNHSGPIQMQEGVIELPTDTNSVTLKTPGHTYFFDIGKTKEGTSYLKITETHLNKEDQKPVRNSVIVFEEHLKEFYLTFSRLMVKLTKP
jgi:hypothetical protein